MEFFSGVGNFPSCSGGLFERCRASRQCASGALCRARLGDQRPCCRAHSDAQCPSTEQLAYACVQRNPVNWLVRIKAGAFCIFPFLKTGKSPPILG